MQHSIVKFSLKPCKNSLLFMVFARARLVKSFGYSPRAQLHADNYFFHNLREELFFISCSRAIISFSVSGTLDETDRNAPALRNLFFKASSGPVAGLRARIVQLLEQPPAPICIVTHPRSALACPALSDSSYAPFLIQTCKPYQKGCGSRRNKCLVRNKLSAGCTLPPNTNNPLGIGYTLLGFWNNLA